MTIQNPNVVIIEDSPTIQRLLIAYLDNYDSYVEINNNIFSHGEAAKQFIKNSTMDIDLIIADIMLPGSVSGIDLLKFIRKDQRFFKIPFIIITANTDKLVKRKCEDLNCNGFLYKPFSIHQLHRLLTKWLKTES